MSNLQNMDQQTKIRYRVCVCACVCVCVCVCGVVCLIYDPIISYSPGTCQLNVLSKRR
jgi:hypothetical protein